jgi:diphosphomevalonate decarboxylase
MTESQFLPKPYASLPHLGEISWRSPSNIALVKYWGKHGEQLPENASISFTLSNCFTTTRLSYQKKDSNQFEIEVILDGEPEDSFKPKIISFFERVEPYLPFLRNYSFKIETSNSFPHSSGIASSASGMSALALCLLSLERSACSVAMNQDQFNKKASFLARLGSGSASRSIEGPLVVWGKHPAIEGSSDLLGIKYPYKIHDNFKAYRDTILLVDKGEKQVSSTVGHNLMHNHPYAAQRFREANTNLGRLKVIFESGNREEFIKIVESEALQLHAMMMTSIPYFILMKPNTLEIIDRIWRFRKHTGSHACFTLDAGANVHLLHPQSESAAVGAFIEAELKGFCKDGEYIEDCLGFGATEIPETGTQRIDNF